MFALGDGKLVMKTATGIGRGDVTSLNHRHLSKAGATPPTRDTGEKWERRYTTWAAGELTVASRY